MTTALPDASPFYPSYGGNPVTAWQRIPLYLLLALLVAAGVLAWVTIDLDHPFILATHSRALYVDEGFYADAAQNLAKFGQWMFPYDSRHWPGAPLLTVLQSAIFLTFGVSLEIARMISVVLTLLACLALHAIARTRFTPLVSMLVSLTGLVSFSFAAHSRTAIADPTACFFAILAILIFVRLRDRRLAIPLSILAGFMAFFGKMYFISALLAIGVLWGVELLVLPLVLKNRFDRQALIYFFTSVILVAIIYLVFYVSFRQDIAVFRQINSNKIPFADPVYLVRKIRDSLLIFPMNTKSWIFLYTIAFSLIAFAARCLVPRLGRSAWNSLINLGRADYAFATWLVGGLLLIGLLPTHKAHYHYFATLPLAYLAFAFLNLAFAGRLFAIAAIIVAVLHINQQVPIYYAWSQRPQQTALFDTARRVKEIIHADTEATMVPVIGEFSAELALFSDRIFSLDARWVSFPVLCKRIDYWRPSYYVKVSWPGADKRDKPLAMISKCPAVEKIEQISRYPVFDRRKDEIVLTKIIYK